MDPATWAEKGNRDYRAGDWDNAISSFKNSLTLDPDQPETWFLKGCCEFALEEYREALDSLRETLGQKPDHWYAANDIAVILWILGEREAARQYLDTAWDHCPPGTSGHDVIAANRGIAGSGGHGTFSFLKLGAPGTPA